MRPGLAFGRLCRLAGACAALLYLAPLLVGPHDAPPLLRRSPLYSCAWPSPHEAARAAAGVARRRGPQRIALHRGADAHFAPLLQMTRATHEAYARRHGYDLLDAPPVPGVDANHLRVYELSERAAAAVPAHDWFAYLDADALVYDERCTFEGLIANRSARGFAALFCADPMGRRGHPWHVNSGVFVANLRHPLAGPLACTWRRRCAWEAWRRDAALTRLYERVAALVRRFPARRRRWVDDQRALHDVLEDFGPRYPSLAQVVPVGACTFNGVGGTLVRHVFGGPMGPRGRKGKLAAMRRALATRERVLARTPSACRQHEPS